MAAMQQAQLAALQQQQLQKQLLAQQQLMQQQVCSLRLSECCSVSITHALVYKPLPKMPPLTARARGLRKLAQQSTQSL